MGDRFFIHQNQGPRRVCLVGAGNIAQIHAEVVRGLATCQLSAVVDPDGAAASRLGQRFGIPHIFRSIFEALDADAFDRAHVLVPPPVHADVARPILAAGKDVLVEKPIADSTVSSRMLVETSAQSGATLSVNQNFLYHPAFRKLQYVLATKILGRPRFINCIYNMPLRQLAARDFRHWMFQAPANILMEQAVHPLSQLVAVAGRVGKLKAIAGKPIKINDDHEFFPDFNIELDCERLPAQLRFAVGQRFPFWQLTIICDDGVVVADIANNCMFTHSRSKYSEPFNNLLNSFATGSLISTNGVRNAVNYGFSLFRLCRNRDPFLASMRHSIGAFHQAIDRQTSTVCDGEFGSHLVDVCEQIREIALPGANPAPASLSPSRLPTNGSPAAVLIGGTGFIGRHIVKRFLEAGMSVGVMARSVTCLPPLFSDPRVRLFRGDASDAEAVAEAIGDSPLVINLAHGGGTAGIALTDRMVKAAATVAQVCLEKRVRRLVHLGSIAALYLGPQHRPITGETPTDADELRRAEYARAKAQCDKLLLNLHSTKGLAVCILRPGLVVGEGGEPFHGGVGNFSNEQHCIGWNAGRNPLPFVLVEDVAEATFLASKAEALDGRCYNLVGDVRISAREYISELANAVERPLRFHGKTVTGNWLLDVGKWVLKRCGGRKAAWPTRRDLLSRGLSASFDCTDAKRELGWAPIADRDMFLRRAIFVHGS